MVLFMNSNNPIIFASHLLGCQKYLICNNMLNSACMHICLYSSREEAEVKEHLKNLAFLADADAKALNPPPTQALSGHIYVYVFETRKA